MLIDSTPGNPAEMEADDNKSLAFEGYDAVRSVKDAVEAACPDVVSCADILTIATRDAIALVRTSFSTVYTDASIDRVVVLEPDDQPAGSCVLRNRATGPSTRWSWAGWTA